MNFVFSYTASKWGHKDIVKLIFSKINKGNVKDTTADDLIIGWKRVLWNKNWIHKLSAKLEFVSFRSISI
jgi:hypothetical protein